MRDSILYSSFRALFVAFFTVIGIILGLIAVLMLVGSLSTSTATTSEAKLKTVTTEEIMPNAEGERKQLSSTSPVILQINIDGIIGSDDLDATAVRQQLIESREGNFKDDRVKALLIHLNTPGGTVVDADGIYRALKEYKEKYKVPIYAYVDGLCASGGMYIAAATDKIYASDVSLIGSVGVVTPPFMNFSKMLDKIGVETLTLTAGTDKDAMNPFRPWKPGEDKEYQNLIDYYYQHFINIVTKNRPEMSKEKLVKDYGAHIFNAVIAKEYGFIDGIDTSIGETIRKLVKEAGIEDNSYQVIKLESKDWFSSLFSSESPILTGKIKHQIMGAPEFDTKLQGQFLYLYRPYAN